MSDFCLFYFLRFLFWVYYWCYLLQGFTKNAASTHCREHLILPYALGLLTFCLASLDLL